MRSDCQEDTPQQLLTVPEVCAELRIGQTLLRALIRRGDIRAVRLGRLIRIPRSEVERIVSGEPTPLAREIRR